MAAKAPEKIVLAGRIQVVHLEKEESSKNNPTDAAISVETLFSGHLTEKQQANLETRYVFDDGRRKAYKAIFRKGAVCYMSGTLAKEKQNTVFLADDLIGIDKAALELAKKNLNEDPNTLRSQIIENGGFSLESSPALLGKDSELMTVETHNLRKWLVDHNLSYDLDFAWAVKTFFHARAVSRSDKGKKLNVLGLLKKNPLMLADFSPDLSVNRLKKAFSFCRDLEITAEMELLARVSEILFRAANQGHSCLPLSYISNRPEIRELLDKLRVPADSRSQKISELVSRNAVCRASDIILSGWDIKPALSEIDAYYEEKLRPYMDLDEEELKAFNRSRVVPTWRIGKFGVFAYLPKLYFSERYVAEALAKHIQSPFKPVSWRNKYAEGLNDEQAAAVKMALSSSISVILGGAGTGKTYVIQRIAKIAQKAGRKTVILAPTATAAANACRGERFENYFTIHRFAKITSDSDDLGTRADFSPHTDEIGNNTIVIVDEMSMCTLPMLARLFKTVKNAQNVQIVFVGDEAQLPAVGANCFQSFTDQLYGNDIPVVRLVHNFRSRNALQTFSANIRAGEFKIPDSKNIHIINTSAKSFLSENLSLIRFEDTLILTCTRREQARLNSILRPLAGLAQSPVTLPNQDGDVTAMNFYVGDPVIATRNDYYDVPDDNEAEDSLFPFATRELRHSGRQQSIYNGTFGTIESFNADTGTVHVRLFPPEAPREGFLLPYNAAELPLLFDTAYCITAHKAQGQERDTVIFIAEDHAANIYRSLLYTVVSRARKSLYLIGDMETFSNAVKTTKELPLSLLPFRYSMEKSKMEDEF